MKLLCTFLSRATIILVTFYGKQQFCVVWDRIWYAVITFGTLIKLLAYIIDWQRYSATNRFFCCPK